MFVWYVAHLVLALFSGTVLCMESEGKIVWHEVTLRLEKGLSYLNPEVVSAIGKHLSMELPKNMLFVPLNYQIRQIIRIANFKTQHSDPVFTDFIPKKFQDIEYLPITCFLNKKTNSWKQYGDDLLQHMELKDKNGTRFKIVLGHKNDMIGSWGDVFLNQTKKMPRYPDSDEDKAYFIKKEILAVENGNIVHGPNGFAFSIRLNVSLMRPSFLRYLPQTVVARLSELLGETLPTNMIFIPLETQLGKNLLISGFEMQPGSAYQDFVPETFLNISYFPLSWFLNEDGSWKKSNDKLRAVQFGVQEITFLFPKIDDSQISLWLDAIQKKPDSACAELAEEELLEQEIFAKNEKGETIHGPKGYSHPSFLDLRDFKTPEGRFLFTPYGIFVTGLSLSFLAFLTWYFHKGKPIGMF